MPRTLSRSSALSSGIGEFPLRQLNSSSQLLLSRPSANSRSHQTGHTLARRPPTPSPACVTASSGLPSRGSTTRTATRTWSASAERSTSTHSRVQCVRLAREPCVIKCSMAGFGGASPSSAGYPEGHFSFDVDSGFNILFVCKRGSTLATARSRPRRVSVHAAKPSSPPKVELLRLLLLFCPSRLVSRCRRRATAS